MRTELRMAQRQCGECSACCTVMAVAELDQAVYTPCRHDAGMGCQVYETRPASCRGYTCLWLDGTITGDERRRPDRLGVIFDYLAGENVVVAREVWPGAIDAEPAQNLVRRFGGQGKAVFVVKQDGSRSLLGDRRVLRSHLDKAGLGYLLDYFEDNERPASTPTRFVFPNPPTVL